MRAIPWLSCYKSLLKNLCLVSRATYSDRLVGKKNPVLKIHASFSWKSPPEFIGLSNITIAHLPISLNIGPSEDGQVKRNHNPSSWAASLLPPTAR